MEKGSPKALINPALSSSKAVVVTGRGNSELLDNHDLALTTASQFSKLHARDGSDLRAGPH